ncbi:hypothetical protein NEIRO03_2751, partial [Nematocida sp. AWRm78]
KQGRGAVEDALGYLALPLYTWTEWSAQAKLTLWLYEIGKSPGPEMRDIIVESRAQVTRMDKPREEWTDEDWETFIEHMLEYVEKKKESVLEKPPRIQDFRPMGAQQYHTWAARFIVYMQRYQYTHQQVLTDIIHFPMNYPHEVKLMWSSAKGSMDETKRELEDLCLRIDKQRAVARAASGRHSEERGRKLPKRLDTRDKQLRFIGTCTYCQKQL